MKKVKDRFLNERKERERERERDRRGFNIQFVPQTLTKCKIFALDDELYRGWVVKYI